MNQRTRTGRDDNGNEVKIDNIVKTTISVMHEATFGVMPSDLKDADPKLRQAFEDLRAHCRRALDVAFELDARGISPEERQALRNGNVY